MAAELQETGFLSAVSVRKHQDKSIAWKTALRSDNIVATAC